MPRSNWNYGDHPGGGWGPRRGREEWQGFGRRMAIGFILFALLNPLTLTIVIVVVLRDQDISNWWVLIPALPFLLLFLLGRVARGFRSIRSVRDLIGAAGSLADGDYSVRVAAARGSTGTVVTSFNQMAERLESAREQRRQLLADLGHELRTPLTVVRGEIEAMLDGVHEPDPDHLRLLLDEVSVMERLLEDLKTLSLAEAGPLALHPEATDIVDLVSDVGDAHRRIAAARDVDISIDATPMPEVLVDPVRLREVVSNLVVNALNAMPDGGLLRLSVLDRGAAIRIRVSDTGVGIAPEDIDTVFDRFNKGSSSQGTGLGLTISRDLVEAHGGTIAIESQPGVGTTVNVTVPRTVV
ncbi:MAG: HAMP domain-containing histidine kinase [Acidimicrobiia bacterium]|nr:HAMP domain-containing histidine kinase [Acidimicrobiia bacterium]